MTTRPSAAAFAAGAAAAYVLWMKLRLYGGLEYELDLFGFQQMATSTLHGRLPLFENGWGRHAAIHAYYTLPLFLPAVVLLGAAGLFAVAVAAYGAAAAAVVRAARPLEPARRRLAGLVAIAAFGSPVALWLVDDAPYGFHPDLLYAPFAVLFALALLEGRRSAALLTGALLAMTREDGALVAFAVQATVVLGTLPGGDGRRLRAAAGVAARWGVVFVAGLSLLLLQSAGEVSESRLDGALVALSRLPHRPAAVAAVAGSAGTAVALVAALAAVALSGLPLGPLAVSGAASLPLVATHLLGGIAANYDTPAALFFHGLSWAPRMASLWGVAAAALVVAAFRAPLPARALASRARVLGLACLGLSLALQASLLSEWRYWSLGRRASPIGLATGEGLRASRLSGAEEAALSGLADALPPRTPLAATPFLFGRFDGHDLVWPDRAGAAWQTPRVVVCDAEGRGRDDRGCLELLSRAQAGGWAVFSVDGLRFAAAPCVPPAALAPLGPPRSSAAEKRAASGGTAETRSGKPKRKLPAGTSWTKE